MKISAANRLCDYIPGVSTVTNLGILALKVSKAAVETLFSKLWKEAPQWTKSEEVQYLASKSIARTLVGLVPVIGNLGIGLYDVAFFISLMSSASSI